jgi:hypothetical protein
MREDRQADRLAAEENNRRLAMGRYVTRQGESVQMAAVTD